MKTSTRAGALALAAITTAGLVAPAAHARSRFERLESPTSVRAAPGEVVARDTDSGGTARTVAVIAAARKREQSRESFPVRGPFNWGQEAAAFGGPRGGRSHEGQDVMSRTGTPVVAVTAGRVLETGDDGGRGNYLDLYDPVRRVTYVYMHMVAPAAAKPGQEVHSGQRLGGVGCTGSCFGDHLHFEIRAGKGSEGQARDPRPLLERLARADGIPATLAPGQS